MATTVNPVDDYDTNPELDKFEDGTSWEDNRGIKVDVYPKDIDVGSIGASTPQIPITVKNNSYTYALSIEGFKAVGDVVISTVNGIKYSEGTTYTVQPNSSLQFTIKVIPNASGILSGGVFIETLDAAGSEFVAVKGTCDLSAAQDFNLDIVALANGILRASVEYIDTESLINISYLYDSQNEILYYSDELITGTITEVSENVNGNITLTTSLGAQYVLRDYKLVKLEQYLGAGSSVYIGSNRQYLRVGDTIPSGTTHVQTLVDGMPQLSKIWTYVSLPATITQISENIYNGQDVITSEGTLEVISTYVEELRNSHNPEGWGVDITGATSSHLQWSKIASEVSKIVGHESHIYRFSEVVTRTLSNCDYDLGGAEVRWNGVAPAPDVTGRDRGVFEFKGSTGTLLESFVSSTLIEEFAEKYECQNSAVLAAESWLIAGMGSLPARAFSYMLRPETEPASATEITLDYMNGWEYVIGTQVNFRQVTPIQNCMIRNFRFVDETDGTGTYDISPVVFQYAHNCHAINVDSNDTKNPVVFGHYCHTCSYKGSYIYEPDKVTGGKGYGAQWNNSVYCVTQDCRGLKHRHTADFTMAAYCYVQSCGGISDQGTFTLHGSYEHDISYEDVYGIFGLANSGPTFGESCKRISIKKHVGDYIAGGNNCISCSIEDSNVRSLVMNSVGTFLKNVTAREITQINNFSRQKGFADGELGLMCNIINPNFVNTDINKNMFDQDLKNTDPITIHGGSVTLAAGDLKGGGLLFHGGTRVKATAILTLSSNDSGGIAVTLRDCVGAGVGFRLGTQNTPTKLKIYGGYYGGNNTSNTFFSNRADGTGKCEFVLKNAEIDWGGTVIMEDTNPTTTNTNFTQNITGNSFEGGTVTLRAARNDNGACVYKDNIRHTGVTETLGAAAANRDVVASILSN